MDSAAPARELALRGLLEFDEPDGEIDFEDDPDPDDEDDEDKAIRFVMLSGMVSVRPLAGRRE